jgi:DNA-directed RNA polymerase specialized sigma24 family protein
VAQDRPCVIRVRAVTCSGAASLQRLPDLRRFLHVRDLTLSVAMPEQTASNLEAVFRAYERGLVRRLALVVGDVEEARDLSQLTFLRAAERWPLAAEQDVGAWLTVVGVRLALSERRRRRRWGFFPVRETDAT